MGSWLDADFSADHIQTQSLPSGLGFVVEGLLSWKECCEIIAHTEQCGYGRTAFPQAYRGNRRLMVDDADGSMGAKLWDRIRAFVPNEINVDWLDEEEDVAAGLWQAVGLNTRYRFSKYYAGERFGIHKDALTFFDTNKCSFLTVNIYLNELEPGQNGRTRFFLERDGQPMCAAGGVAGSAVVFKQQDALHDGQALASGLKYLMRTDVVYVKK